MSDIVTGAARIPAPLERLSAIASDYDVLLCDVWGVVHNGVAAFAEACDALARFRAQGGAVVLITNAPRPSAWVVRMLDKLNVPRNVFDDIVSSGDVTRGVIASRAQERVFHLGPPRDKPLFEGMTPRFGTAETADYVVCSGLFDDETETAETYRPMLERMRARDLLMVCANPDIVVERGDRLIYCAGAIADLYAELGGRVLYAGKPHRPIYETALGKAVAKRGASAALSRVLAIGDSVRTDFSGAKAFGVDCLFVTGGIHAEELGSRDDPDPDALALIFAASGGAPRAVMTRLVW
ncbi:MAG: TIGR01459 family HAD-type hydrolase [Hyphomonadaceae bacterium]|nr:TIGR01459 family HAD-type hydrolase [Hyphomonadaceae bacterium]